MKARLTFTLLFALAILAHAAERIAIYKDGAFVKYGSYPRIALSEPVTTSDGTEYRIERSDAQPPLAEEQRLVRVVIDNDGPDSTYTNLNVRRITYSVQDFTIEEVRAYRLSRLRDRYQQEQATLTSLPEDEIDFRVGIMPILNAVNRTNLPAGQQARFVEERDKVVAYQTKYIANRANATALRNAINAASTIAEIRAVDISGGWAQ